MEISRILVGGLVALGLFARIGDSKADCGDGDEAGDERSVRIAYLANDPTNTYDGATRSAIIAVAAGSHSEVFPFYAGFDPNVQLQQCFGALDAPLDPVPTFRNAGSHWWDGSQIYGSDEDTTKKLREGKGGRLRLSDNMLPLDERGMELSGFTDNWWLGLSLLHTLFELQFGRHLAEPS